MFIPPVIERELRAALRRRKGTKSRSRVAKIGVAIVVFFLLVSALIPWAGWGQSLHKWFFYWGLYLAIAPPIRICVGLFSEERRNCTLELLFLTGVSPGELFLGKLFGGMLVASADMLALAPLLALPFLIGGISVDLYFATIACLPALFLFCVAAGVLASILFKDEGVAFIFMIFLMVGVNLAVPIPYYLGRVLSGAAPFSAKWLCLSPAYAPYLIIEGFAGAGPAVFWRTILAAIAWSGLCLIAAVWFLNRTWREDVQGAAVQTAWRRSWKAWLEGAPHWRADLKARLLPVNPFQWLIQQDRRPVLAGGCAVGLICAIWLLGWRAWPQSWPSNPNFFLTAMVLIVLVDWLTMFAAARRMGTDRRDGIFELLLTTPASPEEIVDGEVKGLEAQFKPLRITVFCLLILMMAMGFHMRSWNARGAITYILIWCIPGVWCLRSPKGGVLRVAWAALNSGQTAYSVFKWRGNKWAWIWLIYNFRGLASLSFGGGSYAFPSGSTTEFMCVCFIGIPAGILYWLGRTVQQEFQSDMRRRMVMDMRLIATEPLPDPHDPSIKNWDGVHRLRRRVSTQFGAGWPGFVDPVEPQSLKAYLDARSQVEKSNRKIGASQDALALFRALNEQGVNYSVVGGPAMNVYFGNREINNIDVLVPNGPLKRVPDLFIEEQTNFFVCAQYRQIRVVAYLTENPFFEEVRAEFQTKVPVAGMEVAMATVEGLIALNLFAVHCLNRQRQYYRIEIYEVNIIALLTLCQPSSLERIVPLLRAHIPVEYQEELEDTLRTCQKEAGRWHNQPIFNKVLKAFGAIS